MGKLWYCTRFQMNQAFLTRLTTIFIHMGALFASVRSAKLKGVSLEYCNSEKKLLVRASDIVANNIYHHALNGEREKLMSTEYLCITHFPLSINNQMH